MADGRWAGIQDSADVSVAVEQVRSAIAALRRHPANRTGWPRAAAAASVRAARASAALDGAPLLMDRAAERVSDPVVAGALRVASEMGAMAAVWPRAPLQVLARLHTLAAADLVDAAELGRPSTTDPALAAGLRGLVESVTTAARPAPVQVAAVHGELICLKPFERANGVVARATARLTMMSTGLDPAGLAVPEVAHLGSAPQYRRLLLALSDGRPGAETEWVLEVCRCLTAGAREGLSIADAIG